jgi:pilus assembly protein Flp/PilA
MRAVLSRLLKNEAGVTAIEYAMIASLIVLAIIGIVSTLGGTLNSLFTSINTSI